MKQKGYQGFTLLELLTVITVLGILAALSVPTLESLVKRNRAVSVTNELLVSYQLARDEAMLRGRRVVVCRRARPASENAVCNEANLGGANHCSCAQGAVDSSNDGWEDGWLVFEDLNENNLADSGETLIKVFDPIAVNFTVRDGDGSPHYERIYFDPDGTSIAGSLQVCQVGTETSADSDRIRTARRVLVSRVGQAVIMNGTECDV